MEPDQIRSQLAEHDKRLAVVETKVDVAQGDIVHIKQAVEKNNDLIAQVRDQQAHNHQTLSSKIDEMSGFQKGAAWLLGLSITVVGLGFVIAQFVSS